MKKLLVVLMIVALVMAFAAPAFAAGHEGPGTPGHPNVDPDKAGRANANAADGLHKAAANVANANGRAAHVLLYWVGPGPGHGAK